MESICHSAGLERVLPGFLAPAISTGMMALNRYCWRPMTRVQPRSFYIGGRVEGASGALTLQNSNGTILIVTQEGAFTFGTPMVSSALYNVTVAVPPNSQACKVTNGSGTVGSTDISNVSVVCAPSTYMLGRRSDRQRLAGGRFIIGACPRDPIPSTHRGRNSR